MSINVVNFHIKPLFMKIGLPLLLLLFFTGTKAQPPSFTVVIDGRQLKHDDHCSLIGMEEELDTVTFRQIIKVPAGRTVARTFPAPSPMLLSLYGNDFLAGAGDSIHISYDSQNKAYHIDGGRYPGNYRLYPLLMAANYHPDRYHPDADNYEEYVGFADSVTTASTEQVQGEWAKGSLTPDAHDYLLAYIRYRHLIALMATRSKTLSAILPATHSRIFPALTAADFNKDEYSGLMDYIFCAMRYIRLHSTDHYFAVSYAIDSLSGVTREKVLYALVVINGLKMKGADSAAFTALFDKIRQLNLPPLYAAAMERRYKKVMRERRPVDPIVLAGVKLRQPDGRTVLFRSILDSQKGQKLAICFRGSGLEIRFGGHLSGDTVTTTTRLITVDLNGTCNDWVRYCRKKDIKADEYYLDGGMKNALLQYLLIDRLPTFVLFDEAGKVADTDMQPEDILRNHIAFVNGSVSMTD